MAESLSKQSISKEVEARRKKLQELRNLKQQRLLQASHGRSVSLITPTNDDISADRVLESVDALLQQTGGLSLSSSTPASSATSSAPNSAPAASASSSSRGPVQLSVVQLESIDIPGTVRITFDKEVQAGSGILLEEKSPSVDELADERERLRQRELELARAMAKVEEERQAWEARNAAATKPPPELSAAEKQRVMQSGEFLQFLARTSAIVERALVAEPDYDITVDFTEEREGDEERKKRAGAALVVRKAVFEDRPATPGGVSQTEGRAVTSLAWSPMHPELFLASYAARERYGGNVYGEDLGGGLAAEPDGTVLIWNAHLPTRPEFSLTCQSAVLSAMFHPTNPRLVIGSTWSGQVVLWDMREKRSPVNRTSLHSGHAFPVFGLRTMQTLNRLGIVSVSTDGQLCMWSDNQLHEPILSLDLSGKNDRDKGFSSIPDLSSIGDKKMGPGLREDITTTCFSFPSRASDVSDSRAASSAGNLVVLGSDEGYLYKAHLYETSTPTGTGRPGIFQAIPAHEAPITAVEFHPMPPKTPPSISELFLTASYDWTVKVWSARLQRPLFVLESARDYVYDVQWSPVHPSLFASGDGTGRLDIWNLNNDGGLDVPEVKIQVRLKDETPGILGEEDSPAISRLKWSDNGLFLAAGTSRGQVVLYSVSPELALPPQDGPTAFYNKVAKAIQQQQQGQAGYASPLPQEGKVPAS